MKILAMKLGSDGGPQVEEMEAGDIPAELLQALLGGPPQFDPEERISEDQFKELNDRRKQMKSVVERVRQAKSFPYDESLIIHLVDQMYKTVYAGNADDNLDQHLEDLIEDYVRIFGDLTEEQLPDLGNLVSWHLSEEHNRLCYADDLRKGKVWEHTANAGKALQLFELLIGIKDHIKNMDCSTCEKKDNCVLLKGWHRAQQKPV